MFLSDCLHNDNFEQIQLTTDIQLFMTCGRIISVYNCSLNDFTV